MLRRRALESISAHARSLDQERHEDTLSEIYADVCAKRQLAAREQEMRAFVVRHSVIRIHAVAAFAIILLIAMIFGHASNVGNFDGVAALIAVVSLVVATSTYSLAAAIRPRGRADNHGA